jgi:hypothetical protein
MRFEPIEDNSLLTKFPIGHLRSGYLVGWLAATRAARGEKSEHQTEPMEVTEGGWHGWYHGMKSGARSADEVKALPFDHIERILHRAMLEMRAEVRQG